MRAQPSTIQPFRDLTVALLATFALTFGSLRSVAQCTFDWRPGEGAPGVVGYGTVFASTTWDPDGFGPRAPLAVFGGSFAAAGDVAARSIAAWDGAQWQAFGDGL